MKDLLVQIIKSVFQYILNPTIWSRVYADTNTSTSNQSFLSVGSRMQSIPGTSSNHDMSLSVDLVQKKVFISNSTNSIEIISSQLETLSIKEPMKTLTKDEIDGSMKLNEEKSNDIVLSSDDSDSYEEIAEKEITQLSSESENENAIQNENVDCIEISSETIQTNTSILSVSVVTNNSTEFNQTSSDSSKLSSGEEMVTSQSLNNCF